MCIFYGGITFKLISLSLSFTRSLSIHSKKKFLSIAQKKNFCLRLIIRDMAMHTHFYIFVGRQKNIYIFACKMITHGCRLKRHGTSLMSENFIIFYLGPFMFVAKKIVIFYFSVVNPKKYLFMMRRAEKKYRIFLVCRGFKKHYSKIVFFFSIRIKIIHLK